MYFINFLYLFTQKYVLFRRGLVTDKYRLEMSRAVIPVDNNVALTNKTYGTVKVRKFIILYIM